MPSIPEINDGHERLREVVLNLVITGMPSIRNGN